ncbi:TetR/AcrR family transcriptional regulator [Thermodesulfobacteriota bacterium]
MVTDKERKEKILNAAVKTMIRKGFSGCTMSDIAQASGLTEPTIYQYFKGKEDLLFSGIARQGVSGYSFYNEHLQGISGGYNKLRKLIWAHLRWSDLHQEYATLSFLECRTNHNFYKSGAYEMIRQYSRMFMGIFKEAVEEGTLRSDLNLTLVRDIILGLLDFEGYTVAITGEIKDSVQDHEDIMRQLDRMLLRKENPSNTKTEKRENILHAATQLFAKRGYTKATISEIASMAHVSDGSVYEYFENKEDLLLSIPEERFANHLKQLEETFTIQSKVRRLRRFIRDHFRLYLEDHNFLIVYLRQIQLNRRFTESRAYQALNGYTKVLEDIVQDGMNSGDFYPDVSIRVFRNMFWGAFTYMGLRWFVVNQSANVDKFSEISEFINLMMDSIQMKDKAAAMT